MISRIYKSTVIACVALGLSGSVFAAEAVSLDDLLKEVKQGRVKDAAENKARIEQFQRDRSNQQQALNNMKAEQAREEKRSQTLEDKFDANDKEIVAAEHALQDRLGDLKELFGVLQQAAGDARGNFENSVTQIQFPDRLDWLTAFAQKEAI